MPTQQSDPRFTRDSITDALRHWHQLETLGQHPLSELRAVQARRVQVNLPDTPRGRGAALQQVLRDLIDGFKPSQVDETAAREPDPRDPAWHTHYILEFAFVQGKSRDFMADTLGLGQRQYFRHQAEAVEALANRLWRLEQASQTTVPTVPSDIPRVADFVGREHELARYQASLRQDHLAVITGLAGTGKTALGAELAFMQQDLGPVLWLTLRHGINTDVDTALRDIALLLRELGQDAYWDFLDREPGERHPLHDEINHLVSALEKDHYTLCVDNYELVNHSAVFTSVMNILRDRAARGGLLDLIVISRERPNFAVDLDIRPLTGLSAADARRLLADGGLDNLPAPLFERVYEITEGNAKFLHLFSAWVTENDLADFDVAGSIESVTAFIEGMWREPDIEHYLLVQVSKALTPDEARTLQVVSAFRQPVDERDQAVVELSTDLGVERPIMVLQGLVRRRILTRQGSTREIECHALIQRYFYDRLREQPALRQDVHHRIGAYYENSRGDALEAAYHYREAGEYGALARVLAARRTDLFAVGHAQRLHDLLVPINPRDVDPDDWAVIAAALDEARAILSDGPATRPSDVGPRQPLVERHPESEGAGGLLGEPATTRPRLTLWLPLALVAAVAAVVLVFLVTTRMRRPAQRVITPAERGGTTVPIAELPFTEDWEAGIDQDQWLLFGDPQPAIYAGVGRGESNAVDSNGDDVFPSGLIGRQPFDISNGIRVQWWLRGHGEGDRRHSVSDIGLSACGPDDDLEQCNEWIVYIETQYTANEVVYLTPEENWREPWDPLDDEWHQYAFSILPDGHVRFFRDGQLKYTAEVPLDLTTYDPLWLHIDGRSLNAVSQVDDVAAWPVFSDSITARYHFREAFTSAADFTSTHPDLVYVDEASSRAVLNVSTAETRLLRRAIPELRSGDFRVTVRGQFNAADNNCEMNVYLTEGELTWENRGDAPLLRTALGFNGGGCPNYFDHISAAWRYPNGEQFNTAQGYTCTGSEGTRIPIARGVPYTAEVDILSSVQMGALTVYDAADEMVGRIVGPAGFESDFGRLDTLSLGSLGHSDWPVCSGYIDSVQIDTIDIGRP